MSARCTHAFGVRRHLRRSAEVNTQGWHQSRAAVAWPDIENPLDRRSLAVLHGRLPSLREIALRRGWPDALVKVVSPDRAEAWYVAAYDPSSEVLWGAYVSASAFRTGTVVRTALAGWDTVEIQPAPLARLAVGWLARRWSAVS
jgi:hypothetical protein